jgi:RNA polymerase-binding protein DksA
MSEKEVEDYRRQLLELGKTLQRNRSTLVQEGLRTTGGEASGSLSNTPLHLADLGSDNFEQEVTLSLLETEQQRLGEIAAALERIDKGTFGHCEECHQEIGRERLRALPYTRLCIDCAHRADQHFPASRVGNL